ncbi:MAG: VTT domain-containing protein [Burkholderiaceae bacterium]
MTRKLEGRWLRPSHLDATRRFFARHGAATIVLARFIPIVRTLAPFLAGAAAMSCGRFAAFNLSGATIWVGALVYARAFFGELPVVNEHLKLISVTVVLVSVLPAIAGAMKARASKARLQSGSPEFPTRS